MPKHVTKKQLRLLLSKGSPLSQKQKSKFECELERGQVTITTKKKKGR